MRVYHCITYLKRNLKKAFYTIITFSFLINSNLKLNAQAGSLDLSFDSDGKATTVIGTGYASGQAVAIQDDGKIVVAGYTSGSSSINNDFALVRYNADGSPDSTFGSGGKVVTDIEGGFDRCTAICLQSDGKIVVAGGNTDFKLVRYNPNGSLDNSFDFDGKLTTDFGSVYDQANSIALQSDGKIVVAGYSNNDFAIARYTINGTLDNSFDTDGKVITNFSSSVFGNSDDYGYSLVIQNDGKIIVAGASTNQFGTDCALARYNTNGSLDTTFGVAGKVVTDLGSSYDEIYCIVLESGGKIISAGKGYNGTDTDFALVRYNSDGTLDNSFDLDGKVSTPIGTIDDDCWSVAIQSDGKIIASGTSNSSMPTYSEFALVRYNNDGSLDNSFDIDGKVTTDFNMDYDYGYSVNIQADGKIVLVGGSIVQSKNCFAIARYYGDGLANISKSSVQPFITAFPNPFTDEILIIGTKEKGEIRIYDVTGKELVYNRTLNDKTKINSEYLKPGYYFLNYKEQNRNTTIKLCKL